MQYLSSYSHKNLRHVVMSANIENNRGLFRSQVREIKHFLSEYQINISVTRSYLLNYITLGDEDLYRDRILDE